MATLWGQRAVLMSCDAKFFRCSTGSKESCAKHGVLRFDKNMCWVNVA